VIDWVSVELLHFEHIMLMIITVHDLSLIAHMLRFRLHMFQ
jgi:hypothetical protein